MAPRDRNYVLTEVEEVPKAEYRPKAGGTRRGNVSTGRIPKVSKKRGWVLITEPVPEKYGRVKQEGNVYDEVVGSFASSRRKSARVVIEGRTVKGMCYGLKAAAQKAGLKDINVHSRKVEGEERVYLSRA